MIVLLLLYWFKVSHAVLAERTDVVFGKLITLIYKATDLAYEALLALRHRLWLDVLQIIVVGHSLSVGHDPRFGHLTYEIGRASCREIV